MPNIPESAGKFAKSEMYAKENHEVVVPDKVGVESLLDFRLDEDPGVSNTFALPFFDYNGVLKNKHYSKNTVSGIRIDN